MDDKTGTRKKPSAISARPAVRPVGALGASATGSTQAILEGQAKASRDIRVEGSPELRVDNMQVFEGGGAKPGPNVKTYIERQLKSVYDDMLNQPIPDRFLDLLNALDGPAGDGAKSVGRAGVKAEDSE